MLQTINGSIGVHHQVASTVVCHLVQAGTPDSSRFKIVNSRTETCQCCTEREGHSMVWCKFVYIV